MYWRRPGALPWPSCSRIRRSLWWAGPLAHMHCDTHRVGRIDFAGQGRARVMNVNRGLVRIYGEVGSCLIVGAEMVGPRSNTPPICSPGRSRSARPYLKPWRCPSTTPWSKRESAPPCETYRASLRVSRKPGSSARNSVLGRDHALGSSCRRTPLCHRLDPASITP